MIQRRNQHPRGGLIDSGTYDTITRSAPEALSRMELGCYYTAYSVE
jgi:hypothetical protein